MTRYRVIKRFDDLRRPNQDIRVGSRSPVIMDTLEDAYYICEACKVADRIYNKIHLRLTDYDYIVIESPSL